MSKKVDIFTFGDCRFDAESLEIVGWKFIKKNIEDGNDITIRASCSAREFGLINKKHLTGKNWKTKLRKKYLLANKI